MDQIVFLNGEYLPLAEARIPEPRLEPVPVRMPFPPALRPGSIYENQLVLANPYFEVDPA